MFIMHVAFSNPPTVMLWKDMSVFLSLGSWSIKTSFLCAVGWDPLYLCFTELNICNGISREHKKECIRIIKGTHAVLAWRNALRHTGTEEENPSNLIWSVVWGERVFYLYVWHWGMFIRVDNLVTYRFGCHNNQRLSERLWLFCSGCEKHEVFLTRYHVQKYTFTWAAFLCFWSWYL